MRVVLTVKCCKHPFMIIYAHKHPQNITKQFQIYLYMYLNKKSYKPFLHTIFVVVMCVGLFGKRSHVGNLFSHVFSDIICCVEMFSFSVVSNFFSTNLLWSQKGWCIHAHSSGNMFFIVFLSTRLKKMFLYKITGIDPTALSSNSKCLKVILYKIINKEDVLSIESWIHRGWCGFVWNQGLHPPKSNT